LKTFYYFEIIKEITFVFSNEICALISTFVDKEEGDFFKKQAGNIIIKEVRNGKTYGNGFLYSFNDQPAEIIYGDQYWYKNGLLHREELIINGYKEIGTDIVLDYTE
jgi:hypothetical protein